MTADVAALCGQNGLMRAERGHTGDALLDLSDESAWMLLRYRQHTSRRSSRQSPIGNAVSGLSRRARVSRSLGAHASLEVAERPESLTEALCRFAVDLDWSQLPSPVQSAVSHTTANALALMVGAAHHPATETALRSFAELGAPAVPILGRREHLSTRWAALVHGVAAHVQDFDDTHPETLVHPGAVIVPAALSAAFASGSSGRKLLTAVAVGIEVSLRVAMSVVPESLERGWHGAGIAGGIGAAAAAARGCGSSENLCCAGNGIGQPGSMP